MKKAPAALLFGLLCMASPLTWATLTANDLTPIDTIKDSLLRVNGERINQADAEPGNWMTHGRTYSEQRYSPLNQINTDTVDKLGLAWYWDTGTRRGLEATPIVVDGILYATGEWSEVYAVDARTGKMLWKNDLNVDRNRGFYACCDVVNRGPAFWQGKVYAGTIDGRLVALDAQTGNIVWDTLTVDLSRPYTITGAPRIVKGKVLIGNGGAEYGVRGYITAYDAETGQKVWRFYTVPGNPEEGFENPALETAAKTWSGGEWWKVGGGGTVWDSMAYDAELDLFYFGVGNGSPWNKHIRSPGGGDNLYLSSIVAVRPDTGEYVWHYQTTPGESWDYTATQHMILADLEIEGKPRKVIMQAPKNGFFYVIDRTNGKFISANNYVPVTWATHIDPETGRPVQTDNSYKDRDVIQFPSPLGGHNWQPMCYSKDTGYVYIPSQEMAMLYNHDNDFNYKPGYWNVGVKAMKDVQVPAWIDREAIKKLGGAAASGFLQAWDPIKQKRVWEVSHAGMWNGGLLCTAGGLLFQGNGQGKLVAYDAKNGKNVWEFDAQQGILAPPITYTIDGEQYISLMVGHGGAGGLSFSPVTNAPEVMSEGGRLMTFKLGADTKLPPIDRKRRLPEPPELTASSDDVAKGDKLYHAQCVYCHGPGAIGHPNLADLRYMDAKTHEQYSAIVLGGSQQAKGMPSFAGKITPEESEQIHAYLTQLGHQALEHETESSLWKSVKNGLYAVIALVVKLFISLFAWLTNAGN